MYGSYTAESAKGKTSNFIHMLKLCFLLIVVVITSARDLNSMQRLSARVTGFTRVDLEALHWFRAGEPPPAAAVTALRASGVFLGAPWYRGV